MWQKFVAVFLVVLVSGATAFYLPGLEAQDHEVNGKVDINVNSLRSLNAIVPYDYYYLPFCRPLPNETKYKDESLGEVLWGDMVQTSPYKVYLKQEQQCVRVNCPPTNDAEVKAKVNVLEQFITNGYRAGVSIDNLPAYDNSSYIFNNHQCTGSIEVPFEQRLKNLRGYALGVHKNCVGKTLVNNHLHFTVDYHKVDDMYRVVGFTVRAFSVKHDQDTDACDRAFDRFNIKKALSIDDLRQGVPPKWSYGVTWRESKITWGSRWDAYFSTSRADSDSRIHWTYIINSLLITLCLSAIATMILMRTLHKDFNRYNSSDPDEQQEEMGWKMVHADVFRPPRHVALFSIVNGTGLQIVLMCACTLFFALAGFLSPANRGGLATTLLLLFTLMSFVAGYFCGRLLKMFDTPQWKIIFGCALCFPGIVFVLFFLVEIIYWQLKSSGGIKFSAFVVLLGLWLGISVPLTVLGASFAFRQTTVQNPAKVGPIARDIPLQRWYFSPPFTYIIPSLIPMGALFLELRFILTSMWEGMVYYVFGFLTLVFIVWLITVALVAVVVIYYQLTYENHLWWWTSFMAPGALGAWLYLYCIYWYFAQLHLSTGFATFLYFTWMGVVSLAYGLAAGFIGFFTCFVFVRKIYGSIKLD